MIDFGVLTPLSAIYQLYHGDQFQWWKKPEYPERTTDHGQATGKLYHVTCGAKATEETPENKPMNYVLYEKMGSIAMTTSKFSIFIKLIPFLFKAKVD